jgi:hypothetical protein
VHDTEAALCVRVLERVGGRFGGDGFDGAAGGEFQKGFAGLRGKVPGEFEEGVFGGGFDLFQPFRGNAVAKAKSAGFGGASTGFSTKCGTSTSRMDSRTSTICAAPVLGWVSILRRSAHW